MSEELKTYESIIFNFEMYAHHDDDCDEEKCLCGYAASWAQIQKLKKELRDFTAALAAKEGEKWVSVEERLPNVPDKPIAWEKYKRILALNQNGTNNGDIKQCHFDGKLWIAEDGDRLLYVTHWRELPQPPAWKQGEKGGL